MQQRAANQPTPAPRTRSIPEREKPAASQQQNPEPGRPGAEAAASLSGGVQTGDHGAQRQFSQEDTAGGYGGNLKPADVFQLAVWSVTPPADDEELSARRAEVRVILQALVDAITGDGSQ